MATTEIPYQLSRRDFLFAKGKSRRRQASRQTELKPPSTQPKPPEKGGFRLTRRQFIPLASVGAATGIGILARILEPWNLSRRYLEQAVAVYYPELTNYPVFSQGEITTDRSRTRWFNLGRIGLNQDLAATTFKFFENLGESQKIVYYNYGRESIPFALDQRPRTERILFFIPQDAPLPNWSDVAYDASTTGQFTNGPYITFIRIPDTAKDIPASTVFTTMEAAVNKAFAVESCQSSLQINSLSPQVAHLGQEIICNSWGSAFTLRQKGMPFRDYKTWAENVLIRKDPNSPSFPLYVLQEADYLAIPNIGMAIAKK